MANYWVTFRIADQGDSADRRDNLYSAISGLMADGKWWIEPTSFVVFASSQAIDEVARSLALAVDQDIDLVLIGMPDFKSARIIGAWEDTDVLRFMPFVERA